MLSRGSTASRRCAEPARRCGDRIDVLVVPTVPRAYRVADLAEDPIGPNSALGTYTNFVNLLDLCALSVPGPFRDDGFPAGTTLIAPAGQDALLASLGTMLHAAPPGRCSAPRRCRCPAGRSSLRRWRPPPTRNRLPRPRWQPGEVEVVVIGGASVGHAAQWRTRGPGGAACGVPSSRRRNTGSTPSRAGRRCGPGLVRVGPAEGPVHRGRGLGPCRSTALDGSWPRSRSLSGSARCGSPTARPRRGSSVKRPGSRVPRTSRDTAAGAASSCKEHEHDGPDDPGHRPAGSRPGPGGARRGCERDRAGLPHGRLLLRQPRARAGRAARRGVRKLAALLRGAPGRQGGGLDGGLPPQSRLRRSRGRVARSRSRSRQQGSLQRRARSRAGRSRGAGRQGVPRPPTSGPTCRGSGRRCSPTTMPCWAFGRVLHRAVAVDLGLPPGYFDNKLRRPLATLRLLHYPAASPEAGSANSGPAPIPTTAT